MSMFLLRKLKGSFVSFTEKPATDAEQDIAAAIQAFFAAFNAQDFDTLERMLADDADIEGVVSASRMTKARYLTVLRESKRTEFFGIDNAIIGMDGETANVHGVLAVCLVAGRSWKVGGSLKLRKEGERWLIFETRVQVPRYLPRGFL